MIADIVNNNKVSEHDQLNMTKLCGEMVQKNLTQQQKDTRKNICSDSMKRHTEQDLLTNVITCNETMNF